jgi:hypothetical protein
VQIGLQSNFPPQGNAVEKQGDIPLINEFAAGQPLSNEIMAETA